MSNVEILRSADYLGHIVEAIDRIQRYCAGLTEQAFTEDEKSQDTVVRNFEVRGEAAHAQVPWSLVYTMRNRISHGYFKVDYALVWTTIHTDLPVLRSQVAALIAK